MILINKISKAELNSFTKFVLREYYQRNNDHPISNEILFEKFQEMYKEDLDFFDCSHYYLAKKNNSIVGSIKVTKWDGEALLPIQSLFGIEPLQQFPQKIIWHVGRFAVYQDPGINTLFKKLMICAVSPIFFSGPGVMLAECDRKLVRTIRLLDIKVDIIGKPLVYLYSEIVPIAIDSVSFRNFIKRQ